MTNDFAAPMARGMSNADNVYATAYCLSGAEIMYDMTKTKIILKQ